MICRIVADLICNLADFHIGINKKVDRIIYSQLLDKICEASAGVVLYQSAKMRLAVVEELGEGRKRQSLIIVLYILKYEREVSTHLVIIELYSTAVVSQKL